MGLLDDEQLERSAVVANCRMNRDRDLLGLNGYGRELGLDPLDFLKGRAASGRTDAWLDLCCGAGRAFIQAAGFAGSGWSSAGGAGRSCCPSATWRRRRGRAELHGPARRGLALRAAPEPLKAAISAPDRLVGGRGRT